MPLVDVTEHNLLHFRQSHGARRGSQIRDRLVTRHDADTLVIRRQKTVVPYLSAGIRRLLRKDDVRGKIAVEGTQRVAEPAADTGHGDRRRPRMHRQGGLEVFQNICVQGANYAQIVGAILQVRKQFADRQAGTATRLELKGRGQEGKLVNRAEAFSVDDLAMVGLKSGLRVKCIDVRKAAREIDEYEPFGFGWKVGGLGSQRSSVVDRRRERKERIKSQSGSGRGRTTQKLPAPYSILLFHGEPPSFSRLLNKLGACHSERSEESAFANFPRLTRFLVACGSSE